MQINNQVIKPSLETSFTETDTLQSINSVSKQLLIDDITNDGLINMDDINVWDSVRHPNAVRENLDLSLVISRLHGGTDTYEASLALVYRKVAYLDLGLSVIKDIERYGDYLYVAAGDEGVLVYDVTAIGDPQLLGQFSDFYASEIELDGATVVVVGGLHLYAVDFSDPNSPVLMDNLMFNTGPISQFVMSDNFAYVSLRSKGLAVVDISKPNDINLVSTMTNTEYVHEV